MRKMLFVATCIAMLSSSAYPQNTGQFDSIVNGIVLSGKHIPQCKTTEVSFEWKRKIYILCDYDPPAAQAKVDVYRLAELGEIFEGTGDVSCEILKPVEHPSIVPPLCALD
jgi:hypothetical protein